MATQYPSDRPRTSAPRSGQPRPAGARPNNARPAGARPAGSRPPGARPNGSRPAGASRPGSRPPQRRRRQPKGRFYLLLAALVVIIAVVVLLIVKPFGSKDPTTSAPKSTVAPAVSETPSDVATQSSASHAESLANLLGNEDAYVEGLSNDELAVVTDLSVNTALPTEEWINILLLGSDERHIEDSARTDSMIICSISKKTGEVKLTSIMRDLAVDLKDIGQYNGTYRINAANYFGGEKLAMKVVNECFGMNIENYVHVNFYGFQQVAQQLGGIEMDITENEMNMINELIYEQAKFAYSAGVDETGLPNEYLETYGPNTHLDGRQTLAYARIRKLDGGDYARAERQRNVLTALMNKLKGAGAGELLALGTTCLQHIRTNMSLEDMLSIATTVCGNGITSVESLRLPINDSYVQETRREQSMLYDCDWSANASALYSFIYN